MSTKEMKISKQEFLAGSKRRSPPEPAFETERMRVFLMRGVIPTDLNLQRDVYFAFRTDEDRPMIVVNAVLWDRRSYLSGDWFVDWLEVASVYRREGFATEFLQGLTKFLDYKVDLTAGSRDGELFLKSFCRE